MSFELISKFKPKGDQGKAIKGLVEGFFKGHRFMTLLGVTGSGKTFTMANVISQIGKPVLVISPNKILAAQLYREYKNFFPENKICYFVSYYDYYQPEAYIPSSDIYISKEAVINKEIDKLRHRATSDLLTGRDVIVVASVSCIYNLGLPLNYLERAIYLEKEKPITRGDLIKHLVRVQYKRTNLELERGKFRVRGNVVEVCSVSEEVIYRIDLKNQKINSLEIFDKTKRKKIKELEQLVIFPAKHFVVFENETEKAIKDIRDELKERINFFKKEKKFLEAERLERKTKQDLIMIKNLGYCHGIENYSRHLSGKLPGEPPETLLSYFPKDKKGRPDFLTIIDESHIAIPQLYGMYKADKKRKEVLIEYGWRLPSALDNRPLMFEEFLERTGALIFTSATPGKFEEKNSSLIAEQTIRPTFLVDPKIEIRPVYDKKRNYSQIDDLLEEVKKTIADKGRIMITTLTKRTTEELTEFLVSKRIKARFMHSETKTLERTKILKGFRKGEFDVLVGVNLLREGLDLPEVSLILILDADREGFLRSKTAFIQIMGRASRNIKGRVILYADKLTGSIERATKETERRRKIQLEYNRKHKIKPKTIKKEIEDLIEIGKIK